MAKITRNRDWGAGGGEAVGILLPLGSETMSTFQFLNEGNGQYGGGWVKRGPEAL